MIAFQEIVELTAGQILQTDPAKRQVPLEPAAERADPVDGCGKSISWTPLLCVKANTPSIYYIGASR